jgi:hypothetical protein
MMVRFWRSMGETMGLGDSLVLSWWDMCRMMMPTYPFAVETEVAVVDFVSSCCRSVDRIPLSAASLSKRLQIVSIGSARRCRIMKA